MSVYLEGDIALRAMLKEMLSKVEKETEAYMFVSNLSLEWGNYLQKAVLLMRKQGLSIDEISSETGLSKSELESYLQD